MDDIDDIKLMRRDINIQTCLNAFQSIAILVIIWFLTHKHHSDKATKGIIAEANPVNSNSLIISNGLAAEEKAKRFGFYTRAQFAEVIGVSVRTLDRRIAAKEVIPPPTKTQSGEVRIPLNAVVVHN